MGDSEFLPVLRVTGGREEAMTMNKAGREPLRSFTLDFHAPGLGETNTSCLSAPGLCSSATATPTD